MVAIKRAEGVNRTEKLLGKLCDRAFLQAWTYPNLHRAKGTELCDLLVVFDDHIFIFSIKNIKFSTKVDVHTAWERWKNRAITKQLKSLRGAKNSILDRPDEIYLDAKCKDPFPLDISGGGYKIHKILVAHGAAEACQKFFGMHNSTGSLLIEYGNEKNTNGLFSGAPFSLFMDKQDPVHVLDSHTLDIVLGELDTARDFTQYLVAKEYAIEKNAVLSYYGEEDLLANYFGNFDESNNKHFISVNEGHWAVIEEDQWDSIRNSAPYMRKIAANEVSYFWDSILHMMCKLVLDGSASGNDKLFSWRSPIYEMAKEPRIIRRYLAEGLLYSIQKQKDSQKNSAAEFRYVALGQSYYKSTAYVLLWVDYSSEQSENEFLQMRREMLKIACGAAKNLRPEFTKIVGIAYGLSDKGKVTLGNLSFLGFDFLLLDCKEWTEEDKLDYEEANKVPNFFGTKDLRWRKMSVREFPQEKGMPKHWK